MTLSTATTHVRRFTRTTVAGSTDTNIMVLIDEAMYRFSKDVFGLSKEAWLDVTPKFNTTASMGIRLTITGSTNNDIVATDISITGTARSDVAGAQIATDLQATIRAAIGSGTEDITVTWDATTWKFTVDAIDSTAITIEAPDGVTFIDATVMLGIAGTGTTSIVGVFPEDCTVETDLPSDFLELIPPVEWDGNPLIPAPFNIVASPGASGTPQYFHILHKKIRLSPVPDRRKSFHIFYKYRPSPFTDAVAEATVEIPLDDEYHMAIVYMAASLCAETNFEGGISDRMFNRYQLEVGKYILQKSNNSTAMFPKAVPRQLPTVDPGVE